MTSKGARMSPTTSSSPPAASRRWTCWARPHQPRRQGDRRKAPPSWPPSSAFACVGAELISAPIDGNGVKTDELEKLIAEHKPKFVYL